MAKSRGEILVTLMNEGLLETEPTDEQIENLNEEEIEVLLDWWSPKATVTRNKPAKPG